MMLDSNIRKIVFVNKILSIVLYNIRVIYNIRVSLQIFVVFQTYRKGKCIFLKITKYLKTLKNNIFSSIEVFLEMVSYI